ncbi:DUF4326 domain-containing protein [Sphingobium abikonense]|uniref:DUF4326 domain-containing protein n=1 Tax=Sphingobium abikonense TaxID=86193 RepID=UPI003511F1B5
MGENPIRVQLRRTKGWRMPPNTVSVARPGLFGNPWPISEAREHAQATGDPMSPAEIVVGWFRIWITGTSSQGRYLPPTLAMIREKLGGKNLACFCPLDQPCHADVLLELANTPKTVEEGR